MPNFKKSLFFNNKIIKLNLFILALAVFCSLIGCCSKQDKTNAVSGEKQVEILFWNTMEGLEADAMKDILKDFHKLYPGIKVRQEFVDFYKARDIFLKEHKKKGELPDVLRADRFWIPNFAANGSLAEIPPEKLGNDDYKDIVPVAKEFCKWQGKNWAVPISVDSLALFYNKDLFKKKNVKVPKTFDEFVKAAELLTDSRDGQYGFFIYPNGWYFEPFFFGFGGQYFDKKGNLAIDSNACRKAFEFLHHIKNNIKAVPPVNLRDKIYQTMISSFNSGQVGMIITGPWAIRKIINGPAFKYKNSNLGVAQLPAGPKGSFSPTGCQTLVISNKSEQKDAALTFVKYMFAAETQKKLVTVNYGMPSRKSVFAAPELKKDPYIQVFIKQLQRSKRAFISPYQSDIYAPLGDKLKDVLNGQLTVEYAVNDIVDEWKRLHRK